ncbi:carbohydrate ABC transporter permease [Jatrophihabitans endophyticus]|uniref:carbohydrate ABC transporter permease n=1 Tax=Jatrophihabitans endophyticus TaxID=1206085 RepID=UPI0019F6C063|nr:carbohydrate ABC transporter permease [Jatrophihabitans endophyticus]MBE7189404.1 carbohydrate ABC transporter permease [Jatrophihabitans endophyticus]
MTVIATSDETRAVDPPARRPRQRAPHAGVLSHVFIIVMAVLWVIPLLFTLYVSLRPESDTNAHGYFSLAHSFTFSNFSDAWTQGQLFHYFINSVKITVPAVVLTLFFASMVAFVVSRFSTTFNLVMLLLFTAGNLLPQQVLLAPLFKIYTNVLLPYSVAGSGELYDSTIGVVAINVAFQTGFCVFVLSNFMRTLPYELTEAAMVDGASIWTQYWRITMPLCRPALAALATLLTTWIYNDFFWALTLMSTGDKRPITSALQNLQGQFQTNQNLLSAAAFIVAVPTLAVYVALQKQFVAGLTLGSTKG